MAKTRKAAKNRPVVRLPESFPIGQRLRTLRAAKNLSQGDIEKKTGLFRCYISRVENGHTVPSLETLHRFASGLEIPLYMLFYQGEGMPEQVGTEESVEKDPFLAKLRHLTARMSEADGQLFLFMAQKMAGG